VALFKPFVTWNLLWCYQSRSVQFVPPWLFSPSFVTDTGIKYCYDAVKVVFLPPPKKPPDLYNCPVMIPQTLIGYITYSSDSNTDNSKCINESFSHEKQVIVGLDTLASSHLFPVISDFVSQIQPIAPIDIHGVGGNIKAIGQGTMNLRYQTTTLEPMNQPKYPKCDFPSNILH
jgi:hypothetical protein